MGIPKTLQKISVMLASFSAIPIGHAVDILNVQAIALSQPSVNALVRRSFDGAPLVSNEVDQFGDPVNDFRLQRLESIPFDVVFLDTGSSGLLLSAATADRVGVQRIHFPDPGGPLVEVADFGIAGSNAFNVSENLFLSVAPDYGSFDNTTFSSYSTTSGPLRAQIGPLVGNPALQGLINVNLAGMPAMVGRVTVMNPRDPTALFSELSMSTFLYNPGTPFDLATVATDPGIPSTSYHVALSYADFDAFTEITPTGAPGQTLEHNPFVGSNPLSSESGPPSVGLTLGTEQASGSFLFDSGAQGSIISEALAAQLNVRYRPGTTGTEMPILETFDPDNPLAEGTPLPEQFFTSLGGVGGTFTAAGFFLDSLLLPTIEGDANNPDDPDHLRYRGVPVTVRDVSFVNAETDETFTLDGILGMNLFAASNKPFALTDPLALDLFDLGSFLSGLTPSPYRWIVFDEPNGILGFELAAVPLPAGAWLLLSAVVALSGARRSNVVERRCGGEGGI